MAVVAFQVFVNTGPASAGVNCADLSPAYGGNQEKMNQYLLKVQQIADLAMIPWDRYYEGAIQSICSGDAPSVNSMIESGSVTYNGVIALTRVLEGHKLNPSKLRHQSFKGWTYEVVRKKVGEMGLCEACADNVANWYINPKTSKCKLLTDSALRGSKNAIRRLKEFPLYCQWNYFEK